MEVRIPDQTLHQLRNNQHSFNEILNYSSPNEWESRIDCPMGSSGVNIYLSVTFLPTSATHRTILWAIGLGLSLYWLAVSDEPRYPRSDVDLCRDISVSAAAAAADCDQV